MKLQFKINLTLLVLGLTGVLSLLLTPIPFDSLPKEALKDIPAEALPYLVLVNPTIFLTMAVIIGGLLTSKVDLGAPLISRILLKENFKATLQHQLKFGVIMGGMAGVMILMLSSVSEPFLSEEFLEIGRKFLLSPVTRFLYGGFTEEILLRWGFMTFIVWLAWKILAGKDKITKPVFYWTGIIVSAVVFGIGHLPIAFLLIKNPSAFLVFYIIIGNTIFGLFAGWLFWKKGIEAAFFAHITVHIVLLTAH